MSEIKVNKISQRSGTAITLGNSGTDFQLPSGADIVAQSGSTITIAAGATITNSGTATGFGPTGAVSWNTTKITADPNPAVSGVGYFCDTSSAAFTVTLPAAPSAGAIVALSDYTGTFGINNLTVGRNGSNIRASATDLVLNVNNIWYYGKHELLKNIEKKDKILDRESKHNSVKGIIIGYEENFNIR